MEIRNKQAALLSNFEVLRLVNEMKSKCHRFNPESNFATILYETSIFLQNTPCAVQTEKKIDKLLRLLLDFPIPLSKEEKLYICNFPPYTLCRFNTIVKDLGEKLPEEEIIAWAQKIKSIVEGK